ncbi:Map microtubule affinity-regulating kinase, partial [Blyttiomyces sp. JEL0837]
PVTADSAAIPPPPSHGAPQPPVSGGHADDESHGGRKRHNTIVGLLRNTMRRQSDVSALVPITPLGHSGGGHNTAVGMSSVAESQGQVGGVGGANMSNVGVALGQVPREASAATMESASSSVISGLPRASTAGVADDNKPRSLRFTFNSNTTSSKPPDEIIGQVVAACDKHGVHHRLTSRFLVECFWTGTGPSAGKDGVKFEIEVCKLPRLKNLHGLRFKRVGGSSGDYKDICEKLLAGI